jgi:hypothetical protein
MEVNATKDSVNAAAVVPFPAELDKSNTLLTAVLWQVIISVLCLLADS